MAQTYTHTYICMLRGKDRKTHKRPNKQCVWYTLKAIIGQFYYFKSLKMVAKMAYTARTRRTAAISRSSTTTTIAHSTRHKPHRMHFIACCKISPNELLHSSLSIRLRVYNTDLYHRMDKIAVCTHHEWKPILPLLLFIT